jgi:hypothetical protein
MIKAIQTKYHGCHFRSRLEARWAVFYDALGIQWSYEHEGFDLGEGVRYLPDFWLPELETWIEIKPHANLSLKELQKCVLFALHHPLMVFAGHVEAPEVTPLGVSGGTRCFAFCPGVKGDIHRFADHAVHQWETGFIAKIPVSMGNYKYEDTLLVEGDQWANIDGRSWYWHERNDGTFHVWPYPTLEATNKETGVVGFFPGDVSVNLVPMLSTRSLNSPRLLAAYNAARSARFER